MPFIKKKEIIEQEFITGFICDKCKREYSYSDFVEFQERFEYYISGGYGSVFGDGYSYEIVLCQHCLKELLGDYFRDVTEYYNEEE